MNNSHEHDQRLKIALDHSMDGIAMLDVSGNYYYLNHEHIVMFGYEKEEELIGKNWQFIYGEDEIERINTSIFPELIQKKHWRGETLGKSKTGEPVPQEISLTLLENGEIICICRNISRQKKEMQQLMLNQEIMEKTNSMIIVANPEGEIEWVNTSFCKVSGYTLDEVKGKKPGKVLQGKNSDQIEIARIRESIQKKEPFYAELLNYKKDGTPYWIEIKGQPLFNAKGEVEHFFAIEEDITARKENQLKLEESNLRLELALKGISAATWELNLETGEVYYSDYLYRMTGYAEGEIKNIFKENSHFMHEDDREKTFAAFAAFLTNKHDNIECEFRIRHKLGHYIWILMRAVISERRISGQPEKIIGILIDISQIKQTQIKLQESESRYRKSLNASGVAIWDWDLVTNQLTATDEYRKLFGLPLNESFHLNYANMIAQVHPDDVGIMENEFQKHFHGETSKLNIEYRFKRLDTGRYEWYELQGAVIERSPENLPLKAMGFSTSVQDQKSMELKLKESEERWYNAMVVSGAGFWEYNIADQKFFFSTQMKNMLGYIRTNHMPDQISFWENRIHKEDILHVKNVVRSVKENKSHAFSLEFRVLNKNEEYIWVSASGICKFDENDEQINFSGAAYDITEKKLSEIAMLKARELAESSVKAKRRFLANVSHEIRTPMHAILGLSEQLSLSELKPEQAILIQIIHDSSKALMNIINDVLDLSKIEEGKFTLDELVFDPGQLIKQTYALFASQAQKKGIAFVLHQPEKDENVYLGDPARIRQVYANIINNAIKFTEQGSINIDLRLEKNGLDQTSIVFICKDTGVGMSETMKKRIFEEFVQEDESFHRKYGGSGLGLSITNELVKLMKGEIIVESKKNAGTTITINIPVRAITDKSFKKADDVFPINLRALQQIRILAAEDNEFNRLLMKFIFEKNKIPYDFAENGKVAVDLAASKHYDIILMDIQMPEMDGLEATQLLRKQHGNEIPIIAITANAIKEELEYYLKNGFTDYLTKPFEEKKLLQKLSLLFQ
jgi:PAS domain S-box-containing protein